jgi:hypothetical protein
MTGAHNHGSFGALDQGARSNGDGDLVPFCWAPIGVNPTHSTNNFPFEMQSALAHLKNLKNNNS